MKKVFLDDLPIWEDGVHKGKINWTESIGYKVKFVYENLEGEFHIVNYKAKGQYLFIKYLDENSFKTNTSNFMYCKLDEFLGEVTNKFKIEIGTIWVFNIHGGVAYL